MDKLLRLSVLIGLLLAIPLCAVIYYGVDNLEKNSKNFGELRKILDSMSGNSLPVSSDPEIYFKGKGPTSESPFPIRRKLSNSKGKIIDCLITGRIADKLRVLSLKNNGNYWIPINKLGSIDKVYAKQLPICETEGVPYPVTRKLSINGSTDPIVYILGRTQFDVTYTPHDKYDVQHNSIAQLSEADRQFIYRLPINKTAPSPFDR